MVARNFNVKPRWQNTCCVQHKDFGYMTSQRHRAHFWVALALGNGLAIFYPVNLFRHASTVADAIFAGLVLHVVMGVLVVVDSICFVIADRNSSGNRSTASRRLSPDLSNVIPFARPSRRYRA